MKHYGLLLYSFLCSNNLTDAAAKLQCFYFKKACSEVARWSGLLSCVGGESGTGISV